MTINGSEQAPIAAARGSESAKGRAERRESSRARTWGLRMGALVMIGAAAGWAYYANVVAGRPTMDMTMRVSPGSSAFPVTLAPVERRRVTGTVVYTGSVAPFAEEDIYPRVTGRIVDMPVYPGDAVRLGQVVARLDDVELSSRVGEATAATTAAEANVAQMEADILAASHGVTQMEREVAMTVADVAAAREGVVQMERELAMVEAEASYQEPLLAREEQLFRVGAVSRQDVENARSMAAVTRAKEQAARAKMNQARAMVLSAQAKAEAARARLEQAGAMEASARRKRDAMAAMAGQSQAQLRTAQVVRDYVNILAPSAGYVVKRLVAPGVLVQPGMAILKIAQVDRVRLQANVGEKDLPSIRVGSPVTVTTTGPEPAPITARVTSVFPFVDQGPRTAVVEAIVENPARRLLPGQYVTMQFVTGERVDALTVPRTAVARMGGKTRVWVIEGDQAQPLEVTTGLENPDLVEITKGLVGTERVVAQGHEGLYAGARVTDVSGVKMTTPTPPAAPGGMPGMSESAAPGPRGGAPAKPEEPAKDEGGAHGTH
jgi:RND family efflux transporter MFP subunit